MLKKFLQNISVRTRLIIFFITLIVFGVIINLITFSNTLKIQHLADKINEQNQANTQALDQIKTSIDQIIIKSYIFIEQKLPYPDFFSFFNNQISIINNNLNQLQAQVRSYEELVLLQKFRTTFRLYENIGLEIIRYYKLGDFDKIQELLLSFYDSYNSVLKDLGKIQQFLKKRYDHEYKLLQEQIKKIRITLILVDLAMAVAIFLFIILFFGEFSYYFKRVKDTLEKLSKGIIPEEDIPESESELGQLARNINRFVESRRRIFQFIQKLKEEKYEEATIEIQSDEDVVAITLKELAKQLADAKKEQERRMKEDEQRRWITEGLNMFSEIMRSTINDLQALGDSVIKNLVKYLDASVGGLFILEDSDPDDVHLELLSAFAYDRKKYYTKRIELGEGLIGTVALDQTTVYLTDVPEDYIEIESGLGDTKPNNLLIVPLKTDRGLHGVYEIAAFKKFEQYELDFAEQVARSIAATLEAVKVNVRTVQLLNETRQKSEELAKREQELRRVMEEMRKAQQESEARAAEMASILNAVSQALLRVEISPDGIVTTVNDAFLRTLKLSRQQVLDEHFKFILPKEPPNLDQVILKKLHSLQIYKDTFHYKVADKDIWLLVQFAPILGPKNELIRILWLSIDITEQKEIEMRNAKLLEESMKKSEELMRAHQIVKRNEIELKSIMEGIDQTLLRAEYSVEGILLFANEKHRKTFGYNYEEVKGKSIFIFIPDEEKEEFARLWKEVSAGKLRQIQVKRKTATGEDIWLLNQYTPIRDEQGNITKILYLAIDITEQVEAEQRAKRLLEESQRIQKELEQKEAELRSILEGIDRAILRAEYTPEGILTFANELHRKTFGYNYEEVLGKSIFIFIPEEEKEEFAKLWQEVASGEMKQVRVRRFTATGEEVWLLNQYTPVRDPETGKVVKILYLAQNITEQVRAEQEARKALEEISKAQEELAQKEAELRSILEGIDRAILRAEYSPDGTLLFANELHRKTLGYNYEEVLGKSIFIFIPDEEKEEFKKLWEEVASGQVKQLRVRRFTATGEEIWLLNQYVPVRDVHTGEVVKILYLAQDITEQVRAEQEARKMLEKAKRHERQLLNFQEVLKKAEAERRAILAGIDRAILRAEYSPDGILLYANELHRETFGYDYEEVLGKSIFYFIPEEEQDEFKKLWAEVVSGKMKQVRVRRYTATGREIWLLNQYTPVRDENGQVYKILYLAQDITDQVRAEQEAKKALLEALRREKELIKLQREMEAAQKKMSGIIGAIDRIIYRTVYNTEGYITDHSQNVLELLRIDTEIIGKHYTDILPKDTIEEFRLAFEQALKGKYIKVEREIQRRDGTVIWLITQFAPIFEEDKVKEILVLNIDITEQKMKEQEVNKLLQEALQREQDLQALLQAVDSTMLRADYSPEGNLLYANERHIKTMGYDFEQMKGKNILEFIPEEERENFMNNIWKKVQSGEPVQIVVKRVRQDTGETIWLLNQYTPVKDEQGNVERIIYMALDITEEKRLEEELAEALKESEYLKKGIDATLLRAEYLPDGTLVDANALHQKTLGYNIEEYRGKNILVFVPEPERDEFMKIWEKVTSGELYTVAVHRQRKDTGESIWLLNQYVPIKNEKGQVERIIYLATDITAQKELETRLLYLLRGIDASLLRAEYLPDGTLLDANELHQKVIGYDLNEFRGKNIIEFVPEEEREGFLENIWKRVAAGEALQIPVRRERKDTGEEIWLLNQYVPVKDEYGNIVRVIYLATDITKQKALERDLAYFKSGIDSTQLRAEYAPDGTLLDANEIHQKVLGYKLEEFKGKNIIEFVPEEEREEFLKIWKKVQGGEPFMVAVARERMDTGERIWLLNQYIPIKDGEGNVVRIVYLATDITEMKQAEELLRYIFKGIDNTMLRAEYTPEGILLDANKLHQQIIGYDIEEYRGKSIFEFIPPEERESFEAYWKQVQQGEIYQIAVRRERKDTGDSIWLLNQYIPIKDHKGDVIRIIYLAIDITQEKELEQRLYYVMQGIDSTLLRAEYTADGILLDANELHQKIIGYKLVDFIGKHITEFVPPEEREGFMKVWEKVVQGEAHQIVVRRERKDTGEDIWLLNQYVPIVDEDGKVVRVIYFAIDITEQKQLEQRLHYLTLGIDATLLRAEYTPDGTLIDANELHQKVLGYDIDSFRGKNILEFVPEESREEFEQIWKQVQKGELKQVVVQRERKDTGEEIWLLNQYVPVKNAEGDVVRIIYLAIDITEYHKIYQEAVTLKEEMEALITAIDATMLKAEYTPDGILLTANERHQKVMGYKLEDMKGKSILEFIPEEGREEFKAVWEDVKKGNPRQIVVRRKNMTTGEEIWLINQYTPVFDKDGNVRKILYLAIDITDRHFNPDLGKSGSNFDSDIDKDINDWLDDIAKG